MFKNIFPDKLNKFVYRGTKKAARKPSEVAGAKPEAKPKDKADQIAAGQKAIDVAAKALSKKPKKTEMLKVSPEAVFLESEKGEVIIYDERGDKLFFSPNGKIFYELKITGAGGSSSYYSGGYEKKQDISFEDPHNILSLLPHHKGELLREAEKKKDKMTDKIILKGRTFKLVKGRSKIEALKLPVIRQPRYFFQLQDGRYIYVSDDKYASSYDSFKLFIGTPANMKEVHIDNIIRAKDGGTTYIRTFEGVLYSPSPLKKDKPTWSDMPLTKISPQEFQVREDEKGLKISKGKKESKK